MGDRRARGDEASVDPRTVLESDGSIGPRSPRPAKTRAGGDRAVTIQQIPRVIAVVVAYNRRDLLIETLAALAAQRRPADGVLVVDNASPDDSAEIARNHPLAPTVLSLPTNTGGSGGFAAGIAHAITAMGADYVWLMDDDTIPSPTALAFLLDAVRGYPGTVSIAGSRAVWIDGRDHPMNTPRVRPLASRGQRARAAMVGARPVRSSSFVSMLVDVNAIRRHGLPMADYFIWNDDFEFSCRLLRRGTGLFVPGSVVEHRTKLFGGSDADPGERFYYEVRNKLWMLTRSPALSPAGRVLYSGATLRRWTKLLIRSHERRVLLHAARRGLRDARRPPRDTAEVLAAVGVDASLGGAGER
jgi:GT2 family glycosyltransferase